MSARSLNKAMLIGNLTRDPELKYLQQGSAVCTFGLATNRSWTTENGDKKEEAEYHRIVAWGKLGELCGQLLKKGTKVYIEGRLQTRSWQTPDGQERSTTEIVADDMMILSPKRDGGMTTMDDDVAPVPSTNNKVDAPKDDINLDDIPF